VFEVAVEPAFDFLSAEYAQLFAYSQATAFQHPLWLDALYRKLAPALSAKPLIVTVRRHGRLIMLLPLLRRRYGTLRAIEFADLGVSDYAAPVVSDENFDEIASDSAACARVKAALKPFDVLRIQKLSEYSGPIERLLGTSPRIAMPMSAHAVRLNDSYPAWRAEKMPTSYRKELDKKSRQLHRKGKVAFGCPETPESIAATLQKMKEYRKPRFGSDDLLQTSAYYDFYLEVAAQGVGSLCRIYNITLDDVPIAGVIGLAHKGHLLVIMGGFDLANHKNLSLGSLIFERVAQHCIEMGDLVLDFTIGDESYKSLFGAEPSPVYQISRSGSALGAVAGLAVEQAPWLKVAVKRFFQGRPALSPAGQGTRG
jgi:CelD/BcsL family acetyltransferase involved in cellulose biosynthesis